MSAERASRLQRRRRALLVLLCATACVGVPAGEVGETAPRYMDQLCADDAYELQGDAVRTTGITDDSCGFVLGPGGGSITFDVTAPGDFDTYQVSALVTVHGSTSWVPLTRAGNAGSSGSGSFTLSTAGEETEVSDVRVRGESSTDCSISRRARRRVLSW